MDKTIVTALLVMAGVISAVFVFNSIYPALVQSGDAMTSMERRMDERLRSQVEIIHAAASGGNVLIWVKNVGTQRVLAVEACDLFFGPEGSFYRVTYGTGAGQWQSVLESGSDWLPTTTIRITLSSTAITPGTRYFIKFVLSNGVYDEYYFGG